MIRRDIGEFCDQMESKLIAEFGLEDYADRVKVAVEGFYEPGLPLIVSVKMPITDAMVLWSEKTGDR